MKNASASMVSAQLVIEQQLDDPSTSFYISDDPLAPGNEFVTAVLAQGVPFVKGQRTTGKVPPVSQLLTPVVASVNRATGTVSSVGFANWYAGQ